MTVTGNLIVAIVTSYPYLDTTMYFLLGNLSFLGFCYCFIMAPKMLADLLSGNLIISFVGCLTQLFFHFIESIKIFLLSFMAYDHYVAISQPLHYTLIMNRVICGLLMAASWLGSFIHSTVEGEMTIQLPFCGLDKLDFYCDLPQLIRLACTDIFVLELPMVSNNGLVTLTCLLVLLGYYIALLVMLQSHSWEGLRKALSTCASHIAVVTLIFLPCIYIYARPFSIFPMDKVVSVLSTEWSPHAESCYLYPEKQRHDYGHGEAVRKQKNLLGPLEL